MAHDATAFDEADLHAFADGRLEPAKAAALAGSLASDRLARARLDGWKRQNDGIRTLFASVLFEPVPVRLLPTSLGPDPVAASAAVPASRRTAGGRAWRAPSGGALATTAIGVALVGFMAGALATLATDGFGTAAWRPRGGDVRAAEAPGLAERAAETFRAVLADPTRAPDFTAADETRLQHWMTRQIAGTARIPDLRQQGWRLVAGRAVPGRYAPAAFLLYGNGAERIGVYVARDPAPAASRVTTFGEDAISVSSWSADGLGLAIASAGEPRGADGVDVIRDAVRHQTGNGSPPP